MANASPSSKPNLKFTSYELQIRPTDGEN